MIGLGLSAGIGHYLRIMAFQRISPAADALFFFYAQRVWAMLLSAGFLTTYRMFRRWRQCRSSLAAVYSLR